ncbi:MAG: anaerobic ribonucleoside-triphosphate reductase activating protein [Candidatus Wallbacteria bacterium]|nr:anaerobic ribonucleoside-triphosphate reductase activating protein [Candidatus Wallbacteria bacterium]
MLIGGFLKKSLIEYPGKISVIVFTRGCNFRCPFCHNPELLDLSVPSQEEGEIFSYLEKYRSWLEAVVISGGEPTLQEDLAGFCSRVKDAGFLVKLETNGSRPDVLTTLINRKLLDLVQMDIKGTVDERRYQDLAVAGWAAMAVQESINLLKSSGVKHEFVTTFIPGIHSDAEIERIRREFGIPSESYRLQKFRPDLVLDMKALGDLGFKKT